jgi:hypothetical protein
MTINEAISMLGSILEDRKPYEGGSGNCAIKLGIEALKRVRAQRKDKAETYLAFLPGETEE